MRLLIDHLDSPIGRLTLVADERGRLRALGWYDERERLEAQLCAASQITLQYKGRQATAIIK